jgi:putative transposase
LLTNYVYKLIPNESQSTEMARWVDLLRSHYNWCLNDRITQYNQQFIQGDYCDIRTKAEACPITCFVSKNGATGEAWKDSKLDKNGKLKNPRRSAGDIQITSLPILKQARPWYADIDSTVLQQNIKRLDKAYENFFEGRGFPKFKNRSNFTSFTYAMSVKVQDSKIYLPKLGWMRFHNSRPIPNGFTIKAATIRKRQDGWYVSVRIQDKTVPDYIPKPLTEVQSVIGLDLGLTKLVHISDKLSDVLIGRGVSRK